MGQSNREGKGERLTGKRSSCVVRGDDEANEKGISKTLLVAEMAPGNYENHNT